jgi:hypothetical protein
VSRTLPHKIAKLARPKPLFVAASATQTVLATPDAILGMVRVTVPARIVPIGFDWACKLCYFYFKSCIFERVLLLDLRFIINVFFFAFFFKVFIAFFRKVFQQDWTFVMFKVSILCDYKKEKD